MARVREFPAFVIVLLIASGLMFVPALHAAGLRELAGRAGLSRPRAVLRAVRDHPGARDDEPASAGAGALPPAVAAARLHPPAADAGDALRGAGARDGARGRLLRDAVVPHHHRSDAVRPPTAHCRAAAPLAVAGRMDGRADGPRHRLRHPRAAQPRRIRDQPGERQPARGGPERQHRGSEPPHPARAPPDHPDLRRTHRGAGDGAVPGRRPAVRRGHPRHGDAFDQLHLSGRGPRGRAVGAPRRDRDRALPAARRVAPRFQRRSAPPDRAAALGSADPADADHRARGDGHSLPAQLRGRGRDRPPGQPDGGAAGDLGEHLHRALLSHHDRAS